MSEPRLPFDDDEAVGQNPDTTETKTVRLNSATTETTVAARSLRDVGVGARSASKGVNGLP